MSKKWAKVGACFLIVSLVASIYIKQNISLDNMGGYFGLLITLSVANVIALFVGVIASICSVVAREPKELFADKCVFALEMLFSFILAFFIFVGLSASV